MAAYADEIVRRAREIPGLINLQSDLKLNKPQLVVHVDREQASDLGVSVRDVASTLQVLLGGAELSTFKLHGETYEVIAQIDRADRANPTDLYGLYVRSESGIMVPLASVVSVEETVTSSGLPHYDRQRAAGISGNLLTGVPLGETLDQVKAIGREVIPEDSGYQVRFSGLSERFYESGSCPRIRVSARRGDGLSRARRPVRELRAIPRRFSSRSRCRSRARCWGSS